MDRRHTPRGHGPGACGQGTRGIRVNTIHPGLVDTDMTASTAPAFRAANLRETPLGRTGTDDDITPLVVFPLSDNASFITGAEIPVDDGPTSHGGASRSRTPCGGLLNRRQRTTEGPFRHGRDPRKSRGGRRRHRPPRRAHPGPVHPGRHRPEGRVEQLRCG
ncbi:SDR family NAD(P)-dependent oxidoreductase [Streptomyces sp. NPDC051554]|uniref:SDR family NAD(P)-dependent oxidoreductase n=1 Tax=Streptomyces sp. NPDC051554 TaxID=3365656 RepID=UPI0037B1D862